MSKEPVHANQMLDGCERYGSTPRVEASGISSIYVMPGTEPASPSDIPWGVQDNCEYHYPEGHECRAPKVRGESFCIGHKKKLANLEKKIAAEAMAEAEQVLLQPVEE